MLFRVRIYDAATGAVADRVADGDSAESIESSIASEGLTVLSISAIKPSVWATRGLAFDVVLFCEELRTLLSSGMSLVEAVDTLSTKQNQGGRIQILNELRQRLLEGKPLSAALEMNRFTFPPLLIASVRASERSSRLGSALDEYIAYEKIGRDLTRKVVSAAIYPSLVVGFGGLVCLFMIAYVVPRFAKVYEDFAQSLSFSTILLMKAGEFAGNNLGLVVMFLVLLACGGMAMHRTGQLSKMLLGMVSRFSPIWRQLRIYQLARIYQTMAMLLRGGYALTDAVPLAQNLAFEKKLHEQITGAKAQIMEGRRLSAAFEEQQLTDNVTLRLLQVGERSGDLANVMDIIAQTHRQEFSLFVERTTKLAEPILLMAVGIMIGAIIILMYMPVFDLASEMG